MQTNQPQSLLVFSSQDNYISELVKHSTQDSFDLGLTDNPLELLTTRLVNQPLDYLHIVAHGRVGYISLAGFEITENTLINSAHLLMRWDVKNIVLWVCEAAQNQQLIESLGRLTGAKIHASSKRLGFDSSTGQRYWSLQSDSLLSTQLATNVFSVEALQTWDHQLISLNFSGIYTATVSGAPDTFFGEETSSITINTTPLSTSQVTFSQAGTQFSGNNVLGTVSYFNGSTTVSIGGLASRPIKVGGVVKGFYVWRDLDSSGAGTSGDTAFVISMDNAYFSANSAINSSSDRVDSALNSLIPANTAPIAVADVSNTGLSAGASGGPALEAGFGVATVNAIGNVISNDTDSADVTVTKAGTSKADTTVNNSTTSANGLEIIGAYGTLKIGADGSYTYAINNTLTPVQQLRTTANTLSDVFTYQITDSQGLTSTTTLTVKIVGSNDAPVANIDYNVAKEYLTGVTNSGFNATGNVLTNDTDVDSGDTKEIATGSANFTISSNTAAKAELTFYGASGFNSVSTGDELFIKLNATTYGATSSNINGSDRISVAATPQDQGNSTYKVSFSGDINYYFNGTSWQPISSLDNLVVGFKNDTGTTTGSNALKEATVGLTETTGGAVVSITSISGALSVGMTVSYVSGGTTYTATVKSISGSTVNLDSAITGTPTSFSFSSAGTYTGSHGTLVLNANGSYTYTPFTDNSLLAAGQSAVETFDYTMKDTAGVTSTSQLKITVYGSSASDPVLINDVADGTGALPASKEASGSLNGTAGVDPAGNVLTNDTTPSGTNTVTAIKLSSTAGAASSVASSTTSASANATTIVGAYGSLKIGANGSYIYTVNNNNTAVQALLDGGTLNDVFVYTVNNGTASSTATLTVAIQGANDNPDAINDTASATEKGGLNNDVGGSNPIGNVLVNDSDVDHSPAQLTVTAVGTTTANTAVNGGTSSADGTTIVGSYGSLKLGANGTWAYTIDEANATVNALAVGAFVDDVFSYQVTDAANGSTTATLTVRVNGAADTVAVNNVYVNEASPYAVFNITGVAGQTLNLSLGNSTGLAASDSKVTLGTDLSNTLEYWNAAANNGNGAWATYSTSVAMPAGGSLLVRVAITQDTSHEGNESFTLNIATADGSIARGIGTIGDEAEGNIFLATNNSSTPNGSNDAGYPARLDDDRPLTVGNIRVNEGSAYAMFQVTGVAGQLVTLALSAGTATIVTNATPLTNGSEDFGPSLEYWNETANGGAGAWSSYTAGDYIAVASNGKLLVRTAIVNDTMFEGDHTFTLTASNTSNIGAVGTATIDDQGGGVKYVFGGANGAFIETNTLSLNDDRAVTVSSPTVNEASNWAVFSVTSSPNSSVSLSLVEGTGSSFANIDQTQAIEYWDGNNWVDYNGPSVTVPAGGVLLVRVDIRQEQDNTNEVNETFILRVGQGGSNFDGTATIVDDGNGTIYPDSTPTNSTTPAMVTTPTSLDDDRPLTIANIRVNEGSSHALFEVTGAIGQLTKLALTAGTATIATSGSPPTDGTEDFGSGLQYWDETANTNTGGWVNYTANNFVPVSSTGKLLVRTAIVNDSLDEGDHTFTLTATNTSNLSGTGTATIDDRGAGVKYLFGGTNGASSGTSSSGLDDDRSIAVSSPIVNEASNWAIFNVTANAGTVLSLSVVEGAGDGFANIDQTQAIEYWDGNNWVDYNGPSVTVPAGGVLLVRVDIRQEQDNTNEVNETFILRVGQGGSNFDGTATIVDDGNGTIYPDSTPTNSTTPAMVTTPTSLDDDRPLTIANIRVNEGSSHALFEVTGAIGQLTKLALTAGTATIATSGSPPTDGTEDFGSGLQYWDETANTNTGGWVNYTANNFVPVSSTGKLLVRTAIVNDSLDEGDHTFTLTATNTSNLSGTGTATIDDRGAGVKYLFGGTNGASSGTSSSGLDDDRMITVSSPTVNEASDWAVFTITASAGAILTLATVEGNGSGFANIDQTQAIEYWDGNNWVDYNGPSVTVPAGGVLLVRVDIRQEQDNTNEVNETFILRVGQGGSNFDGTATIVDDGNGVIYPNTNPTNPATPNASTNNLDNDQNTNNGGGGGGGGAGSTNNPQPRAKLLETQAIQNTTDTTRIVSPTLVIDTVNTVSPTDTVVLTNVTTGAAIGQAKGSSSDLANNNKQAAVPTKDILDDGEYEVKVTVKDSNGNVKEEATTIVKIITDQDGVAPSTELAGNNGDFNKDGVLDWEQNNVTQLPITSVNAFKQGSSANPNSFGAVMVGNVTSKARVPVALDSGAQLINVSVRELPAALPTRIIAATPMMNFTVTSQNNANLLTVSDLQQNATLQDIDVSTPGLQTRVVIDLPAGVTANDFMKYNTATQSWYSFLDDQNLATFDTGATLIDSNGDGLVDRVAITLTDGGFGDEDGVANGVIVDPGLLTYSQSDNTPVYSVLLKNGERFLTQSPTEAAAKAKGVGNIFEGARFDATLSDTGGQNLKVYYNPLTKDWFYGLADQAPPYDCYILMDAMVGFMASAIGEGVGQDYHLYLNKAGITQFMTTDEAAQLNLLNKGYRDLGAVFRTTNEAAFKFDAEGFLIANKDQADIQDLVETLQSQYTKTSSTGFIEMVEAYYLTQAVLVGLPHGVSASAADLNATFGTTFGA